MGGPIWEIEFHDQDAHARRAHSRHRRGADARLRPRISCATQATDKKLAGAAKTSFMKKCVKDTCDGQAADKKLAGAAKTSFTTKCMKDAMGG